MLGEGVKIILIAIGGIFAVEWIMQLDWAVTFGLVPAMVLDGRVYQLVTYQFIHGNFLHVLFNAMGIFFFGPPLERQWGTGKFLAYFIGTGVAGGILATVLAPHSPIPVIGCSGSVYGILAASAVLFPEAVIYLWMIVPIRAKWLVTGLGIYEFVMLFRGESGISHEAHLGGLIVGGLYVMLSEKYLGYRLKRWYRQWQYNREWSEREKVRERERETKDGLRKEVDDLLDKVNKSGLHSLTEAERKRLDDASKKLRGK